MRSTFLALIGLALGIVCGYAAALAMAVPQPGPQPLPQRFETACAAPAERQPPAALAPAAPEPEPDLTHELDALRAENAELRRMLEAEPADTPREENPAPVAPATLQPHGDEARELRARLGRDPTDAELETLRQKLEAQRAATIGAETERIQALEATMAALKDGDAVSTLRLMQELTPAIRATVRNGEVFSTWFERKTSGPAMDGSAISERNPIVDGATVRFGAGKHVWKVSGLGRADKPFPADVLVVGAGRDETLLSLDEIEATSDVRSLTFQDLTLDCANNYLSDMRSKNGSTIRFERCRIVRFDMGAGGSVMLSSRGGLAFYATDTLITCGYGRSPGSGHLFRVQGVLMVRMERCTVEGPMYGLFSDHGQACYCFVDCSFNNVPKLFEEPVAPEELGAIFERCTFEGLGDAKARQLKLADINPAWKTD